MKRQKIIAIYGWNIKDKFNFLSAFSCVLNFFSPDILIFVQSYKWLQSRQYFLSFFFFCVLFQVLYRTAMAILILFHKSSSAPSSEWLMEIQKNGIDSALNKFCKEMPVTPQKVLKVAFGIRGLSSAYISRVFIRTEMVLKSKNVINGSRQLVRSRSSENLPNSQSQNNIQMVSHTLTIREVSV